MCNMQKERRIRKYLIYFTIRQVREKSETQVGMTSINEQINSPQPSSLFREQNETTQHNTTFLERYHFAQFVIRNIQILIRTPKKGVKLR